MQHVADRQVVGVFSDYAGAEQAVDSLVARGFPVEGLRVTGHDLRLLVDVTGPLTYAAAAARGLLAGVPFGVLLAVLFGALDLLDPLVSAVTLAVWGAVAGGLSGVVVATAGRWLEEGRRDFTSTNRVEADRYELVCDGDRAEEARRILAPVI